MLKGEKDERKEWLPLKPRPPTKPLVFKERTMGKYEDARPLWEPLKPRPEGAEFKKPAVLCVNCRWYFKRPLFALFAMEQKHNCTHREDGRAKIKCFVTGKDVLDTCLIDCELKNMSGDCKDFEEKA